MKYIKKYENYEHLGYIVWHEYDSDNYKDIIEILKIVKDTTHMRVREIFRYDMIIDEMIEISATMQYIDTELDSDYMIFRSDDLEECKEYIEIYTTTKKYNL